MDYKEFCNCLKHSSVHTDFDDWYQYDICDECGKIIEDSIRPLDDNGDF